MINLKYIFLTLAILALHSCKNNDDAYRKAIIGTWDVYASNMNEKPNGFMKDGYFIFSESNKVTSNILEGSDLPTFSLENNRLIIDMEQKFDMQITRLDQDTMFLEGKLSFYDMQYFLAKRK